MNNPAEPTINEWEDVVSAARAAFAVAIEGDDWLGVQYSDSAEEPAPQKVRLQWFTALGQRYLAITADLFDHSLLPADLALQINNKLPIGAVESEGENLLLRATVPLQGLAGLYFRRLIVHIARQAEHMRRTVAKHGAAVSPFSYCSD
jgi:hypothetical protein